ncbi:MAG: sulfotransferase domain-containing protein [Thiobacillus sp.]|nr:sulfotransferase domain-containing protein [Thiobacillus sp.]
MNENLNSEKAKSVIWVVSFPKSGNTWVQAVVRGAGRSYGFPAADLDVYKMKAENRQPSVVRGIQKGVSRGRTTVLKTHSGYLENQEIHPELGLKTVGFVYVMRNPLDMLLSYINFTRVQYEKRQDDREFQRTIFSELLGFDRPIPYEKWVETKLEDIPRKNLDHALSRFAELETAIPGMRNMTKGGWLEHCMSWRKASETLPSVIFRYEDLLMGPESFIPLQRLFIFSAEEITAAAEKVDQGLRALQGKKIFFNKMSAYYFPEYFSPDVVRKFLDKFEIELKLLGYGNLFEKVPG